MSFRKVGGFDQSQISLPQDGAAVKTDVSTSQRLGMDAVVDAIEPSLVANDGPVIPDFGIFNSLVRKGFSAPDIPERFTDSQTMESPDVSPRGDEVNDFRSERFDLRTALHAGV